MAFDPRFHPYCLAMIAAASSAGSEARWMGNVHIHVQI